MQTVFFVQSGTDYFANGMPPASLQMRVTKFQVIGGQLKVRADAVRAL
ncbi:MAG: hypothetical protein MUO77_12570 [Anaerolineales bacterium]|nr:hypothetical protein [Anaerolineales bacterium]